MLMLAELVNNSNCLDDHVLGGGNFDSRAIWSAATKTFTFLAKAFTLLALHDFA